jgi:hypothetical protein
MFREACPERSRRAQFARGRIRRGGHDSAICKTSSGSSDFFRYGVGAESGECEKRNFNRRTFMLGEKIGEISGKVTMQRVLANLGGAPKMETSFQANGSLLGTDLKDTGTYWTVVRPDGTQYGEGQGVMITKDGKMATWTGHGVGTMKKDGSATYRGAIYLQTMPPKWSRLNKVAVLFEYAVDAEGNTHSEYWEWK